VDCGRREHRLVALAGQLHVLKPRVDELHIARIFQVLLGDTDQLISRLDRGHAQPSREEAARQLTGPAPDLEHPVAIPDACRLACLIDERIGVGRASAVVLDRNLVEDLAVAPRERPIAHARNVHTRRDGRPISVSPNVARN
jgi:hypothetical protein